MPVYSFGERADDLGYFSKTLSKVSGQHQQAYRRRHAACSRASGKGVINMRAIPKISKVAASRWSTTKTEIMVISQFGKIIRIGTKPVAPPAGRHGHQTPQLDGGERGTLL
jgi:hypothetical protein